MGILPCNPCCLVKKKVNSEVHKAKGLMHYYVYLPFQDSSAEQSSLRNTKEKDEEE